MRAIDAFYAISEDRRPHFSSFEEGYKAAAAENPSQARALTATEMRSHAADIIGFEIGDRTPAIKRYGAAGVLCLKAAAYLLRAGKGPVETVSEREGE